MLGRTVIRRDEIRSIVERMAAAIDADLVGRTPVFIGVLKGCVYFFTDLTSRLSHPVEVDFIQVSSYGASTESSGSVVLVKDLTIDIRDRDVYLVEDIVDTGYTLAYLIRTLAARQPASLKTCVLVHRPDRREVYAQIDYLGFEIPDAWVVGCGLDWAEKYWTLPYIGVVKTEE